MMALVKIAQPSAVKKEGLVKKRRNYLKETSSSLTYKFKIKTLRAYFEGL